MVTLVQSYFFQSFGLVENIRNSFPCGLAIGSQRALSSQGHLPLTKAEKLTRTTTKQIAKDFSSIVRFVTVRWEVDGSGLSGMRPLGCGNWRFAFVHHVISFN